MNKDQNLPPSVEKHLAQQKDTFEQHRSCPDVSFDMYMRAKRQEIGERALSRRRVYLDQRFWIHCRDAETASKSARPVHQEIWRLLQLAVSSEILWCPLHAAVFMETRKQEQWSQLATAKIIDQLSGGIAICLPEDRAIVEISHWLNSVLHPDNTLRSLRHYVWMPAGHVLGVSKLQCPALGDELELAVQKTMYDISESMPLEGILAALEGDRINRVGAEGTDLRMQNLLCALYREQFRSWPECFRIEVQGMIENFRDQIIMCAKSLHESGADTTRLGLDCSDCLELAKNIEVLILSGISLGRLGTEISSIHIPALLHSAVRYEGRKFKQGDLYDFQHAAAALPFCDAFFTDKAMAAILKSRHARLDKHYDCVVLSSDDDVVSYLRALV